MTRPPLTPDERERLLTLQRLVTAAVRGSEHVPTSPGEMGLHPKDAAAVERQDPRRLLVYKKLVRATIRSAIVLEVPRTVARMPTEALERDVDSFCALELPRSRVLRDVAYEWATWASPRWMTDPSLPRYLGELARYELFEFDVYTGPERAEGDYGDRHVEGLDVRMGVALHGSARVACFDWAVHRLPDDPDDRTEPELSATGLLGYRDAEGRFRELELTPLAASILALLGPGGRSLGDAVTTAARLHFEAIDADVLDGTARLLTDLAERGVVLGSRCADASPQSPSPFARWLFGPGLERLLGA